MWHRLVCVLISLAVVVPAAANPPTPELSFDEEGAAHRLARVLQLIEGGATMDVIDRDQWEELVAKHRAAIEQTTTHRAFAYALNAMLGSAGISHFEYFTDEQWEYWFLLSAFELDDPQFKVAGVGIWPQRINGRWFVRGVMEGSVAASTRIKVGDELMSVDGERFDPILSFRGKGGQPTRMRIRRKPGLIYNLSVTPTKESLYEQAQRAIQRSIKVIEYEGMSLVYAHIWTLLGPGVEYRLLAEMQPDVDGLLLDYRDGFGGWPNAARTFLTGRVGSTAYAHRSRFWTKPAVILTGQGTRSAKELVVHAAQAAGRAVLVGTPTPGEVAGVRSFPRIGTDGLLMKPCFRFSLEGKPTQPDLLVERELPYSAGEDPQLRVAKSVVAGLIRERRRIAKESGDRSRSRSVSVPSIVAD